MTKTVEKKDLYITHPGVGKTFHIFKDGRSLCGSYMMLSKDPSRCGPLKKSTVWVKGQDCKACWRKVGLVE